MHYFNSTELGKIHPLLPDDQFAGLFPTKKPQGAKPWLTSAGKIRLMLLKHYSGLSDEKLVERLNTDWVYQVFCHLELLPGEIIKDQSLVTRVGKEVSALGWSRLQNLFQSHWKPLLSPQELKTLLMDASRRGTDAMKVGFAIPLMQSYCGNLANGYIKVSLGCVLRFHCGDLVISS